MKRFQSILLGDIRFQFTYGFYLLYAVMTLLYILLLNAVPHAYRTETGVLLVFSDPAAMGLFFMGAILLLEKSQRVVSSLAVSPVKPSEYVLSKALSLSLISSLTGLVLSAAAGIPYLLPSVSATFLGSLLFSFLGMTAAARSRSLNQFFAFTMPVELLCFLPPLFYYLSGGLNAEGISGTVNRILQFHPGAVMMQFYGGMDRYFLLRLLVICFWLFLAYRAACRSIAYRFLCKQKKAVSCPSESGGASHVK